MTLLVRLLQARQKKLGKLSADTAISEERLRALMDGAMPSMAEVRKIALVVNVPVTELLAQEEPSDPLPMMFRQAFQAPTKIQAKVSPSQSYDKVASANRLFQSASRALELIIPEPSTYNWTQEIPPVEESYQGAEQLSFTFRELFVGGDQLAPLLSLPELVEEQLHIPVLVTKAGAKEGASAVIGGVPVIIVAPRFEPRMLFTLAHELGHVLFHHDFSKNFVVVDDGDSDEFRHEKNRAEAFANAFASALLLPPKGLGVALKAIKKTTGSSGDQVGDIEILYVAHIFGVSFQVAAQRCEAYGILPRGGGAALYEQLQREYGSPEKRAQAAGLPPRPEIRFPPVSRVLLEHAVRRVRQEDISIGRAAEALSMTVSDLTAFNAFPLQ